MEAGGQGDEAAVVFLQQLFVHPGPVVKAFQVGLGDQADEIVVAHLVLARTTR